MGLGDHAHTVLLERLAMYASAAEARCEKLHEQLSSAGNMARTLRREASQRRRRSASRR